MSDTITGYKLCTLDDVRNISTVHRAYSGMDDRIDNWIRVASTHVISHTNREFLYAESVEEFYPTPDRGPQELDTWSVQPYSIYLQMPNVDLSTLRVWLDYRYTFTDDTLLTLGANDGTKQDYFIEPLRSNPALIRVTFTRWLRQHNRAVKVSYTGGYQTDDVDPCLILAPREVVQATAVQAGFLMSRSGNEDIGTGDVKRQVARRDPRITPSGITPEAAFMLRKWRRALSDPM